MPNHYYRDLYLKLQGLHQGNRSIDDYYKEMEMAMIRANVEEDREATMARFLNGLNREIANTIELHHYVELEDLVHMAIKVERQLKSHTRASNSSGSLPWKSSYVNEDEKPAAKLISEPRQDTTSYGSQGKPDPSTTRMLGSKYALRIENQY